MLEFHFVRIDNYMRAVFDNVIDEILREVCLEIEKKYEEYLLEIWTDKNHVNS